MLVPARLLKAARTLAVTVLWCVILVATQRP